MYDASSDVSAVNANAGVKPVRVAPEVAEAVYNAKRISVLSNGAFDPTVGPLSLLWRTNGGENQRDELPSAPEIEGALSLVDTDSLAVTHPDPGLYLPADPISPVEPGEVFLRKPGMALDLGGIAKGYASGAVGGFLRANGVRSAIVDLGGNILAVGARPGGEPWRIGVRRPQKKRDEALFSIAVRDMSVITAGVYERSAEIDGKRYTHIFDPRTGYPIGGSLLSATVPSNSPMFGDALSTAFMVMGVEKSLELLYFLPGNDAVFISAGADGALEIIATDGLESARDANGALGFVAYDRSRARHSGKKRGYRRYVCGPDGLIEAAP